MFGATFNLITRVGQANLMKKAHIIPMLCIYNTDVMYSSNNVYAIF